MPRHKTLTLIWLHAVFPLGFPINQPSYIHWQMSAQKKKKEKKKGENKNR